MAIAEKWSNGCRSTSGIALTTQASRLASAGVALQHDAVHRPRNLVDGVGTTLYAYTSGGQLLTEDSPFASNTVTNTSGCSSSPRACVPPANPSAPRSTT